MGYFDTRPVNSALGRHAYLSTACQHGLHDRCRQVCKFCAAKCDCRCHQVGLY